MKSLKTGLGKRHHRHPLSKKAPLTEPDACFRKLRTSALSALETSFFAKGMEAAYIDAMMESGIVFPPLLRRNCIISSAAPPPGTEADQMTPTMQEQEAGSAKRPSSTAD